MGLVIVGSRDDFLVSFKGHELHEQAGGKRVRGLQQRHVSADHTPVF